MRTRKDMLALIRNIAQGGGAEEISRSLRKLGFHSSPALADSLRKLVLDLCLDESAGEKCAAVVPPFLETAYPEDAILNLVRYLDTIRDSNAFLNTLAHGRPMVEMLATTFGSSRYMADIIIRNPGIIYWLIEKRTWDREESIEDFTRELDGEIGNFHTYQGKINAVKRYHRRMLLKIGVQDLLGQSSIEKTTSGLSCLAEAIIRTALAAVWEEVLTKPYPQAQADGRMDAHTPSASAVQPATSGFAVIALGKLGGRELNYSSDIDLVYLCQDVDDNGLAFYRTIAEKLTEALSETTDEGYLYRVDLRLRPDGESGPIVNTMEAMRIYYETRGKPWEFQAYLKSRVVAGDVELGETFLQRISSLIFNPSLPYSPVEDIALLRARIQQTISIRDRAFNIKLMEGGIRDVEFMVQTLQLLHGNKCRALRTTNTIAAIHEIRKEHLLDEWEAETLLDAYRFFRLVEHRLQMMHQIKTHTVPELETEISLLAKRCSAGPLGSFSTDQFLEALTEHLNKVRFLSESFFSGKNTPETSLLIILPDVDKRAKTMLESFGINDAKQAIHVIHSMAYGSFPRLLDRKARAAFELLLPVLLEDVSHTGDPGLTLVNISKIASASGNEYSSYRFLLEEKQMRKLLIILSALSSPLTRKLCAHPEAMDHLLMETDDLVRSSLEPFAPGGASEEGLLTPGGDADKVMERVKTNLDLLELAAFVLDVKERSLPDRLSSALAAFVRKLLSRLFAALVKDERAVLFALGSYGVGEPRLLSDVDILVVSDIKRSRLSRENLIKKIQTLSAAVTDSGIFKLDFRLRGEGSNAPLVQDINQYEQYFKSRISPWEKIAFAKCCFWGGDLQTHEAFLRSLASALSQPFSKDEIATLLEIRKKLESKVPAALELWETKRSRGGRYDIEYLCGAGIAFVCEGTSYPFSRPTAARLEVVAEAGLIDADDALACSEALRLFSALEYIMELQGLTFPTSGKRLLEITGYLERSFALLDINLPDGLEQTLLGAKERVRDCFNRVFKRIA